MTEEEIKFMKRFEAEEAIKANFKDNQQKVA